MEIASLVILTKDIFSNASTFKNDVSIFHGSNPHFLMIFLNSPTQFRRFFLFFQWTNGFYCAILPIRVISIEKTSSSLIFSESQKASLKQIPKATFFIETLYSFLLKNCPNCTTLPLTCLSILKIKRNFK